MWQYVQLVWLVCVRLPRLGTNAVLQPIALCLGPGALMYVVAQYSRLRSSHAKVRDEPEMRPPVLQAAATPRGTNSQKMARTTVLHHAALR